jgi:uncharacterized membrane protein YsdA (DUF1294 family)
MPKSKHKRLHRNRPRSDRTWAVLTLLLIVLGMVSFAAVTKWNRRYLPAGYLLAVNLTTFILYWADKRAAKAATSRVPELLLHLAALVGGSVGAMAGQLLCRHKTRKMKFQLVFWGIVMLQVVGIIVYFATR